MNFFSTGQAAKMLGIKQYQLLYLVSTGKIPDSLVRVAGKRAWAEREIATVKTLLDNEAANRTSPAGNESNVGVANAES